MTETNQKSHTQESKNQQKKPVQEFKAAQEAGAPLLETPGIDADPRQLQSMLLDSRRSTIQRQEAATQIGQLKGNTYLSALLQGQGSIRAIGDSKLLQRVDDPPVGHGQSTPFGTYWIVPDDVFESYPGVEGEQITESAYAILEQTWSQLESGSGNLRITETDSAGSEHAGFRSRMMDQIGILLSQPTGRALVVNLMEGRENRVTIRPTAANVYGGGNAIRTEGANALEQASGEAGSGSGTIIQIDPNLQDDDALVFDARGNEIASPVFIALGHEMIHAQHNRAGRNRREQAAGDADYTNREEEETIATGSTTTENMIRGEHGLPARHGHAGRDTRPGM